MASSEPTKSSSSAGAPATEGQQRELTKALTLRAGDAWCALPLGRVRRLLTGLRLFPLPGAGPEIAGLAEVDGEPLVVLSLERLVDAPAGAAADHEVTVLALAGAGDGSGGTSAAEVVGLRADEAGEIVRLDPDAIVGPPKGLVRGEMRGERGLLRVLDLDELGGRT